MNDIVSIIIPVYNRENYIKVCIDSLLKQTYQHIEIVLIDDGSTDNTLKICKTLAEHDSRITILTTNHSGASNARNYGIDNAKGKYILFVDSDDAIHPQTVENLVKQINNHDCAIAVVKGKDIKEKNWDNETQKEFISQKAFDDIIFYSNSEALEEFFQNRKLMQRAGGVMLRTDYIGSTRHNTELHLGEDICFLYENLIKGSNVVVLKDKYYYWRLHPTKISRDLSVAGFLSRLKCKEFLWKSEEAIGRTKNCTREKTDAYKIFIKQLSLVGFSSNDGKEIRKIFKTHKKCIMPALKSPQKLRLFLAFYAPWLYFPIRKSYLKHKKKISQKREQ